MMRMLLLVALLLFACIGLLDARRSGLTECFLKWVGKTIPKFGKIGHSGQALKSKWILAARLWMGGPNDYARGSSSLQVYDNVQQTFAFEIRNGKKAVHSAKLYSYGDFLSGDRPFTTAIMKPMMGDAIESEYRLFLAMHRPVCSNVPVGWFLQGKPDRRLLARRN